MRGLTVLQTYRQGLLRRNRHCLGWYLIVLRADIRRLLSLAEHLVQLLYDAFLRHV